MSRQSELPPIRYSEGWRAPWWLWALAVAVAVGLAAEIHLGYPGPRAWIPYLVLPSVAVAVVWWLGRITVTVSDTVIRVDDASLPLDYVATVTALRGADLRAALGVAAHPLAFVVRRPWLRQAVKIEMCDPADPTPYWLVSTKRAAALTTVIAARAGAKTPQPVA